MVRVLVLGGGVIGAAAAIRLARDGHEVEVVDRDPGPLPADAHEANTTWRRAIGQFGRPHALLPRAHRWFEDHAPEVLVELRGLGATPFDMLRDLAPPGLHDGLGDEPDDDRFLTLATRRPTLELAVHRVLEREPGVTVHRGARVTALRADTRSGGEPVTVTGAVTADGRAFGADLVLDATGRRSPVDALLHDLGATPLPVEEVDNDFCYHGRYYASADGSIPPIPGMLVPAGTISLLTIPSDNGTWSIVVYSTGDDHELRGLADETVFEDVVRAHPSHAHLVDGTPITPVQRMVSEAGRRRRVVTEHGPVVLGLLPVGDAWGSTNPSYGRGITLGVLQVDAVAAAIAAHAEDLDALAHAWQTGIDAAVAPWWQDTVAADTARVAQIERLRAGATAGTGDGATEGSDDGAGERGDPSPVAQFVAAFRRAAGRDPDVLRAMTDIACCNALPSDVLARPGLVDRITALGSHGDPGATTRRSAPSRAELVRLAARG